MSMEQQQHSNITPDDVPPRPKADNEGDTMPFRFVDLKQHMEFPSGLEHIPNADFWQRAPPPGWQPLNEGDELCRFSKKYRTINKNEIQTTFTFVQKPGAPDYTIREFYPALVRVVWSICWGKWEGQKDCEEHNVLMIGQPGLGRTVSMFFIMACVLAIYPDQPFLFVRTDNSYLFHGKAVYRYDGAAETLSCTEGRCTRMLCFMDIDGQTTENFHLPLKFTRDLSSGSLRIIHASPPRAQNYASWDKISRGTRVSLPRASPNEIVDMLVQDHGTYKRVTDMTAPNDVLDKDAILRTLKDAIPGQWFTVISAVIAYQSCSNIREDVSPPLPSSTESTRFPDDTRKRLGLLVDFFIEQFGAAPQDVIAAIQNPEGAYEQVQEAIQRVGCSHTDFADMVQRLSQESLIKIESHVLLTVTYGKVLDGGISLGKQRTWEFKSFPISQEITDAILQWGQIEQRHVYQTVASMRPSGKSLLGWFFEALSMRQLSDYGGVLYSMEKVQELSSDY